MFRLRVYCMNRKIPSFYHVNVELKNSSRVQESFARTVLGGVISAIFVFFACADILADKRSQVSHWCRIITTGRIIGAERPRLISQKIVVILYAWSTTVVMT